MWVKKQCTNWDLSLRKAFPSQLKEKSVSAGWKEKEVMFIFLAFKREAKEFDRQREKETDREKETEKGFTTSEKEIVLPHWKPD